MTSMLKAERFLQFSVITKIFVLICMIIGTSVCDFHFTYILNIFGLLFMAIQGMPATKGYFVFLLVMFALVQLMSVNMLNGYIFSEAYIFMIWKMSPVIIAAFVLIKAPPGEIISVLQHLRVPRKAMLMLIVAFRFVPTAVSETRMIKDAMKNRGMLYAGHMVRHPVQTLEYVLVPLLIRSMNIADELSVSAITRGAECPGEKHSYYETRMHFIDYLGICICISLTILLAAG